jgi:anthranilate synthase/aminodeoxychorismate synthase-like glutamine amidotransferase
MILLLDNYDSFTYNLVQLMTSRGVEVRVVRNDAASVDELLELAPAGIVISPGPGRPEEAGVAVELLVRRPAMPVLGVCLGLQALGVAWGGRVDRAPCPMHGKTSQVRHSGIGLFAGLPDPFEATRYHSLALVEEELPAELEAVAWSEDGTLQAVRHRELPHWGVQFHPESILTREGPRLIENFLALCGEKGAVASA